MAGNKVDFDQAKNAQAKPVDTAADKSGKQSSTIAYPVYDLDAAAGVAQHVYNRSGLGVCPLDELAAEAGVTISGNFRNKNASAKLFGFIEKDGASKVKLTDLGARVVSAEAEADARANAFLNVPLYNMIYEKYRGKLLPPAKALEREMVTLGVNPTQSASARQILLRSARQGGYFNSGEDRLVRPRATAGETIEQAAADAPPAQTEQNDTSRRGHSGGGNSGGNGGGNGRYHPFIEGLLQTLPEPGTLWTVEGRAAWLQAAAQNFTLIYKGEGKIDVSPVPTKHDKAA